MRLLLVVLLALVASCSCAAAWAAAPEGALQAGPILVGDTLVYGAGRGRDAVILRTQVGGGPATELGRLTSSSPDDSWLVDTIAASDEGFAFRVANVSSLPGGGITNYNVHAAPFGGPLHELNTCSTYGGVSVVGRRVVFDDCEPSLGDIDGAGSQEPLAGEAGSGVRAAGDFALWRERRALVLYDLRTRRVVRRVALRLIGGRVHSYDVDADGTVVAGTVQRVRTANGRRVPRLTLVSTVSGARRLRQIRAPYSPHFELRAARGRVALLGHRQIGTGTGRLVVVDSRGRLQRISSRAHVNLSTSFDFDGRRVAWAEPSPAGLRFRVTALR